MTDQQKRTAVNTATISFAKSVRDNAISKVINVIKTATTNEPTSKITPTFYIGDHATNAFSVNMRSITSMNIYVITYNGDGNLYLFDSIGNVQATIQTRTNDTILKIVSGNGTFKVGATEGTNYAAATPVTVTVIGNGSEPIIATDNENVTLYMPIEDTEATAQIRELCYQGLLNEGNILAYLTENIQSDLSGLVDTGSDMFDAFTVQIGGDVPDEPLTVNYTTENLVFDDGVNYYVIFTTDDSVSEYTLIEAVGQNDGSITFELLVEFIAEYLDTPMTMIVLKAQE